LDIGSTGEKEAAILPGGFPGAKFVEMPGNAHLPWVGDQNAILKEVEDFVRGLERLPMCGADLV
jgi:hypothetical protein